jgi:hypothetical protein
MALCPLHGFPHPALLARCGLCGWSPDQPPTSPPADTSPGSGQMDLDRNVVESGPPRTPGPSFESLRGQQQALPVTVPRAYHSKAWGGTVTEPPLPEED